MATIWRKLVILGRGLRHKYSIYLESLRVSILFHRRCFGFTSISILFVICLFVILYICFTVVHMVNNIFCYLSLYSFIRKSKMLSEKSNILNKSEITNSSFIPQIVGFGRLSRRSQ